MSAKALLLAALSVGPLGLLAQEGCSGVPPAHAARDTNPEILDGDSMNEVREKWGNPDAIEVYHDVPTSTTITSWRYDVRRGVGTHTVSTFIQFREGGVVKVDKMDASARTPDLLTPDTTKRHDGF